MNPKPVTLFVALVAGVAALPVFSGGTTATPAQAQPPAGLLEQVGQLETTVQDARSLLEQARGKLAAKDPPAAADLAPSPQPVIVAPPIAAAKKAPRIKANTASRPANMATVFQWECPDQVSEHSFHTISIVTDAAHLLPIVRDGYDKLPIFGPVTSQPNADNPNLRLLEYAWTAAPNADGYGVEVITFDPERGIQMHSQRVRVIPSGEPDPPPGPPPGSGLGIAAKVPAWLATVPAAGRGNAPAIKAATLDLSRKPAQFDTVAEYKTAFTAVLTQAITDLAAWSDFGAGWNGEIVRLEGAGKIKTPADFAQALIELGGAL